MFVNKLKNQLLGFLSAVGRYPLVLIFLIAMVIVNIISIQKGDDIYSDILYTLMIGTSLSGVAQQNYEHFFSKMKERISLYVGIILLTASYYFAIHLPASAMLEVETKTSVLFFALMMVFISVPSIKSDVTFDKSFMATVKVFFTTLLFTVVIAIGVNFVIFAVDHLLISVNGKVYSHVFNIILTLFAPLFFLSLIPKYVGGGVAGTEEQYVEMTKATEVSKLFEVLLSYIMIPLAGIYTLILVIYVLLSIRSEFWSDNLLEPMLVSYSIAIVVNDVNFYDRQYNGNVHLFIELK